jgi:hypothetical protein
MKAGYQASTLRTTPFTRNPGGAVWVGQQPLANRVGPHVRAPHLGEGEEKPMVARQLVDRGGLAASVTMVRN